VIFLKNYSKLMVRAERIQQLAKTDFQGFFSISQSNQSNLIIGQLELMIEELLRMPTSKVSHIIGIMKNFGIY